jgi:hypothetical protein
MEITYPEAKEPVTINLSLDPNIKITDLNAKLHLKLGEFEQGN